MKSDEHLLLEPTMGSLVSYQLKRNFELTPEPAAGGKSVADRLRFVIQKHWATSLHYDFRLELDSVLKSWAVPKGPSFDPKVKRMAVQVEDHPLSYADFEGTIPAKQYGAGKVIVWDTGTWVPSQDPHQGFRDGNLKFDLFGHKLLGKWVLVRMKGIGQKQMAWLLIKEKDSYARSSASYSVVDELPGSVKALEPPSHVSDSDQGLNPFASGAVPSDLPESLAPQLATLVSGPPSDVDEWIYEIKFDGYRLLVRNDSAGARFLTRNGHDWTLKLQPLQISFERLRLPPGWYDGEVVVPNEDGIPDFGALQSAFDSGRTTQVVLYLFDVPYFAGQDLRAVPLQARRRVLKELLANSGSEQIRFSEAFDGELQSVITSACKLGLEGVIAKRKNSIYRSSRSTDWVKLKCSQRQEFVIGGYTAPQGARKGFGALLLGVHDAQGVLQYAGDVGTGFTESILKSLHRTLEAQLQSTSPFAVDSQIDGRPKWVTPTLIAEVSFGEWTRAGRIRHAVFKGLRDDKEASAVVREKTLRMASTGSSKTVLGRRALTPLKPLQVTNPQRVIDSSSGTTKVELVRFYGLVGELMMKHLEGRPVSLLRAPDGVETKKFFQKHLETERLPGISQMGSGREAEPLPMIEITSRLGLLSAAQWNVVEFHTMNTSKVALENPDRMVFDLDPGEGVTWNQVQEAAQLVHSFLIQLGLSSFLKTSGGKGLHVVVPVKRLHDWGTVKGFSKAIVVHMAKTIPQRFVTRSGPKNRMGKIFIDYLRNGEGATTVSAWSARARPGLGISVPVTWEELTSLRGGDHWSIKTVHERLGIGNGPWVGYAKGAHSLTAAMSTLGYARPSV